MSSAKLIAYADSRAAALVPKPGDLVDLITVLADGSERKGSLVFMLKRVPKTKYLKGRLLACRDSEVSQAWHGEGLTNKVITFAFASKVEELAGRIDGKHEPVKAWRVLCTAATGFEDVDLKDFPPPMRESMQADFENYKELLSEEDLGTAPSPKAAISFISFILVCDACLWVDFVVVIVGVE